MSRFTGTLSTPRDLLGKAQRELDRLKDAMDEDDQIDHAYNCAVSTWHLVDWLSKSTDPVLKAELLALGIATYDDLHALVRRESDALHLCYQVATGSKHFELSARLYTSMREPVVSEVTVTAMPSVGYMASPFPAPLKIVLSNKDRVRAEAVFEEAIKYWEGFLSKVKQ